MSQTIPPVDESRPWYKKKRYVIPLGVFLVFAVGGQLDDGSTTSATASPTTVVSASAPTTTTTTTTEPAETPATSTTVKPTTSHMAAVRHRTARTTAPQPPAVHKVRSKPKPRRTTRTTTATHRRIVTPGAFCKDAEAGDIGYSRTGHVYRCSYYASSDRNRWKRVG